MTQDMDFEGRCPGDEVVGTSQGAIVEVSDLVVRFGDFTAVDGISFHVNRGEIFGFLGPNGAGKTTTIRTITTIQKQTSGSVTIDGYDSSAQYLEARKRIGIAQIGINEFRLSVDEIDSTFMTGVDIQFTTVTFLLVDDDLPAKHRPVLVW